MSDKTSGRDDLNSGSDSAVHHKGTASQQYNSATTQSTTTQSTATPITGKHPNGFVGNGKPGPADERSKVK